MKGKLAFKTKQIEWIGTCNPVIVPVSIQSSFHEGLPGDLKMNAFISTIKSHVKGKITILFCEKAHLQVSTLKHNNNYQKALDESIFQARSMANRFKSYFEGCHLEYWQTYICEDKDYSLSHKHIVELYQTDIEFQSAIISDAEATYTENRVLDFPDKRLFVEKAIEDILEQCICLLILSKKRYHYQFYPGSQYLSVNYLNRTLLSNPITFIDVFLTIEKKIISQLNRN